MRFEEFSLEDELLLRDELLLELDNYRKKIEQIFARARERQQTKESS